MSRPRATLVAVVAGAALLVGSCAVLFARRTESTPVAETFDAVAIRTVEEAPAPFVVARLGSATWLAPDTVRDVQFLPDASAVVAVDEWRVRILPLPEGRPVREFELPRHGSVQWALERTIGRRIVPSDPWDARALDSTRRKLLAMAESGRTFVVAAGRRIAAVDPNTGAARSFVDLKGDVTFVGAPRCGDRVLLRADGGLREWRIGTAETKLLAVCGAVVATSETTGAVVAQVPGRDPDGVVLAAFDDEGRILGELSDGARDVCFSPDGSRLAWLGGGGEGLYATSVQVARVAALAEAASFTPGGGDIRGLVWHDGRTLLAGRFEGRATLLDADAGTTLGDADGRDVVAFSADLRLRAGARGEELHVEDAGTGESAVRDPGPRESGSVVFRPGRREYACSAADGSVELVDAESGRVVRRLDGPGDYVWSLAFDPAGERLLVNRNGDSVDLLDVDGAKPPVRWQRHACCIGFADGHPIGLSGNRETPWRRTSFEDGEETLLPDAAPDLAGWEVRPSTDGAHAVGYAVGGDLLVWDLARMAVDARLPHPGERGRIYASDGARRIVVLTKNRFLAFDTARPLASPLDLGPGPNSEPVNPDCAISPDGRWFAARDADDDVAVWDLADGRRRATLRGFTDSYCVDLAFSHDSQRLAAGPRNAGVGCVWDVAAAVR